MMKQNNETNNNSTKNESRKPRRTPKTTAPEQNKSTKKAVGAFDEEKREFTFGVTRATTDAEATESGLILTSAVSVTEKTCVFPRNIKAGELENVGRLVFGKMLYYQAQKSLAETAKLEKAEEKEPLTAMQECKKKALEEQRKAIKSLRLKHKTAHAELIANSTADMLASYWSGEVLPINLQPLAVAMSENYKTLHELNKKLLHDGKAEMSEDDKKAIKAFKDALVATMQIYCNESAWFDGFKLSASNDDVLAFYELSLLRYDEENPVFIYTADKNGKYCKAMSAELVKWVLRKMKATYEK